MRPGLKELAARLAQARVEEAMAQALAAQAERMADAVRQRLSDPPGAGGHDGPWLQAGALRGSVGAHLQDLGHIFRSERPDPEGEDEGRSPEGGADPVKPAFKPDDAHNPRSRSYDRNKDPEPSDSEEVYEDAQRDPRPNKRAWYGKDADGERYQCHVDNTGGAHYAGTVRDQEVPITIRRRRK